MEHISCLAGPLCSELLPELLDRPDELAGLDQALGTFDTAHVVVPRRSTDVCEASEAKASRGRRTRSALCVAARKQRSQQEIAGDFEQQTTSPSGQVLLDSY